MSRIEQVINEMDEYITECKSVPFSANRISVDRDVIMDYIRELRMKTPEEIKKFQKIISNKDSILRDARAQADNIVREAKIHTEELINEHEIMQRAYEQANAIIADAQNKAQQILDEAQTYANDVRLGSIQYTDDMLGNLQMIVEHAIETAKSRYDALLTALNKDLNIVMANRNELKPANEAEVAEEEKSETAENKADEEVDDDGPTDEEV